MKISRKKFKRVSYGNVYSYFVLDKFESIKRDVLIDYSLELNKKIGSLFVDILNKKEYLYGSFNKFINKVKTLNTIDELDKNLYVFCDKYWNSEELNLISFKLYNIFFEYKKQYCKDLTTLIEYEEESLEYLKRVLVNDDALQMLFPTETLDKARKNVQLDINMSIERIKKYRDTSDIWKIKELTELFDEYFFNIKSILNNFCQYIDENDYNNKEKIKKYILWGMELPKCYIDFGVKEKKNNIHIAYVWSYDFFEKNNNIEKLINFKRYEIKDFIELLNINIDYYFQNDFFVNKCKNCGKFFIPVSRIDEKYCNNISLQNNQKTCRELGAKKIYRDKLNSDIIKKAHYNISQYFRMKIKRAKTDKEKEKTIKVFDKYKIDYKKNLKKYSKLVITEKEFYNWIQNQRNCLRR